MCFKRREAMKTIGDIQIGIYPNRLIIVCPMSEADMREIRLHAENQKITKGAILLDWKKVNP